QDHRLLRAAARALPDLERSRRRDRLAVVRRAGSRREGSGRAAAQRGGNLRMSLASAPTSMARLRLARARADLVGGLRRWELWGTLGWRDIRQRYRRSTLGPFWLTISMGVMVAALGLVYAELFGHTLADYLPQLALGLIVWSFISTPIVDGCNI